MAAKTNKKQNYLLESYQPAIIVVILMVAFTALLVS